MATVKAHDTYPPLRFKIGDEGGLIDLTSAASIKLTLTGAATISGPVAYINPPDNDGFNASYSWRPGETDVVGSYQGEIEITWDATPPAAIETVPNTGTFQLVIEADLG